MRRWVGRLKRRSRCSFRTPIPAAESVSAANRARSNSNASTTRANSERCADIYRAFCGDHRVDLLLGPYSSGLTRVAAPIAEQAGMLLVNHGGADDDIFSQHHRLIVGVLSPASDYFNGFVRLVAGMKLWRKRIAIVRSTSGFAEAIAEGIERECKQRYARRKGVRIRVKFAGKFDPESTPRNCFLRSQRNRVNALVSAGSYEHDLAVMGAVTRSPLNIPVLGCVAGGRREISHRSGRGCRGSGRAEPVGGSTTVPSRARTDTARFRSRDARANSECPVRLSGRAGIRGGAADQSRDRKCSEPRRDENSRGFFGSSHHHIFRRLLDRSRDRQADRPSRATGAVAWRPARW